MTKSSKTKQYKSAREKFLALSLESTRKSYYPRLKEHLDILEKNERRLWLLTDNLPARISYIDSEERFVFVNREYEKAFGLKRSEIIGKHLQNILKEKNYSRAKKHIQKALSGNNVRFEALFTGKEGKEKWFEVNFVPDIDPVQGVIGFYDLTLDLTEKKHAEQERANLQKKLQHAQKMEAIGTLAGGLAHDFNNLLMGIQGHTSLISMDVDPLHPGSANINKHINAIEEYILSASNLTKQLLGFARGGKYEVKPTDINKLILNSSNMFGRTKKEIQIHTKLHPSPMVVEADRGQIEQVLINIYVNTWQAMPDGGRLYLKTKSIMLDEAYCKPHQVKPGCYVKVSITDTGTGMDDITCQRVFDPFFTTKEKERGTGLGLASAYGIIKNHGGIISVYSEIGHGATFNIYLPLSHREEYQKITMEKDIIKGTETILIVDDEEMILDVCQEMLKNMGYRVIVSRGGQEALKLITNKENKIDLVILDLIMPGMDGGKTFDNIRKIDPKIPVMLSSGYAINGQAEQIMARGCNGFIQKPFTIPELSQKIRQILNETKITK